MEYLLSRPFSPSRGRWVRRRALSTCRQFLDALPCSVIIVDMDYRQIITIDPDKRSGQACIRGLRMTVRDVLEYLAAGMTPQAIVDDFPDLTLQDIQACLAFAADRERRLWTVPAA